MTRSPDQYPRPLTPHQVLELRATIDLAKAHGKAGRQQVVERYAKRFERLERLLELNQKGNQDE